MEKRLFRSKDKALGGVCGGLAEFLCIDPSIVRVLTLVAALATGIGSFVIVYIVCWAVIPDWDKNPELIGGDSNEANGICE